MKKPQSELLCSTENTFHEAPETLNQVQALSSIRGYFPKIVILYKIQYFVFQQTPAVSQAAEGLCSLHKNWTFCSQTQSVDIKCKRMVDYYFQNAYSKWVSLGIFGKCWQHTNF